MLRALGGILLLLALGVVASDLAPVLSGGGALRLSTIGAWWASVGGAGREALGAGLDEDQPGAIGEGVMLLLEAPLAVALGVLGWILWELGRPPKDPPSGRGKLDFNRKGRR